MMTDNKGKARDAVTIRPWMPGDLSVITAIYRACFSSYGMARVGVHCAQRYFEGVSTRDAYRLYVAESNGLSGFSVLVVAREGLIGKAWLMGSPLVWGGLLRLAVCHPKWAFRHAIRSLRWNLTGGSSRGARRLSAAAKFDKAESAWIELLAVSPAAQGRGLASALMNYMFHESSSLGFDCIKLNVDKGNSKAIAVYEKQGFVRTVESDKQYTYARMLD